MKTPKEKAIEHIIYSRNDKVIYPIKDNTTGLYVKIVEAIDIALKEQAKEIFKEIRKITNEYFNCNLNAWSYSDLINLEQKHIKEEK